MDSMGVNGITGTKVVGGNNTGIPDAIFFIPVKFRGTVDYYTSTRTRVENIQSHFGITSSKFFCYKLKTIKP